MRFSTTRRAAGLEIILLPGGGMQLHLVRVKLRGPHLTLEEQVAGLESLEAAGKQLPAGTAVSLVVNGKGVLHKKATGSTLTPSEAVGEVLPNADAEEFYVQVHPSGNLAFVSLLRRNVLDALLDQCRANNITVVSVSLGAFAALPLLPNPDANPCIFAFAGHQLHLENDALQSYTLSKPGETTELVALEEGLQLDERLLLSYAAALGALVPGNGTAVRVPAVEQQRSEWRARQRFVFTRDLAILCGGVLLVMHCGLGWSVNQTHQQLRATEYALKELVTQSDSLQKDIAAKTLFLEQSGWHASDRLSFYADRIAATVPASIRLTELSVNPLDEKLSKTVKQIAFSNGMIRLVGQCHQPTELNPWIAGLKAQPWAREVAIHSYSFDPTTGNGHFIITLKQQ